MGSKGGLARHKMSFKNMLREGLKNRQDICESRILIKKSLLFQFPTLPPRGYLWCQNQENHRGQNSHAWAPLTAWKEECRGILHSVLHVVQKLLTGLAFIDSLFHITLLELPTKDGSHKLI
jgi:hypothetical protein